jgi:hypothetical protein
LTSAAACLALLGLASCGDDDNDEGTVVDVTLAEFSVTPAETSAPPGKVTFHVTNVGEDMHEFLVVKTNLPPGGLPTNPDGSYEEDGPGTEVVEEIELLNPGQTKNLTVNLASGAYVLLCNMVMEEDDELEVHYALGMRTGFHASS